MAGGVTELEAIRQRAEKRRAAHRWQDCDAQFYGGVCCGAEADEDLKLALALLDEHHEKYDKIFWAISHHDKPCPVCKERV